LSHRWGDGEFVKLTKSELSNFKSGFPVKMLRKTFQDAIVVAQRMNVSYIWIDSLCIIQDDDSDWQRESATMAEVYSNSFCNISADWGDRSNGLFFERTPIFEPPYNLHIRLKYPKTSVRPELPRLQPIRSFCHIIRPRGWPERVMESPLNLRGWVFQERVLAPRVLHFSPEGVSWECGQRLAWERAPLGFDDSGYLASFYGLWDLAYTCSRMGRLKLHGAIRTVGWPRLVEDYARCELTKQSDRLVAIAGIAKVLASAVEDQYVAGIWKRNLPQGLTWRISEERRCSPVTQYYTPSFSWAAAEGNVMWPRVSPRAVNSISATFIKYRKKPFTPALDSTMGAGFWGQVLTQHVFGPMTSPEVEVRVQGMLRSCRRVPLQRVPVDWPSHSSWTNAWAYPSTDIKDSSINPCFENGTVFGVVYDRAAERDAEADTTVYYYTCTSYTPSGHLPTDPSTAEDVNGVLLRSVDKSMGRFERVGYVGHRSSDGLGSGSDIRLWLGNERELPAFYDETTGQHTFFIV
jgi:hypothetical protein